MISEYTPGMRVIIRGEEWMIRKSEKNSLQNNALYCVGISPLVKDREAIFLDDLEKIEVVDPTNVKLVPDNSPHFRRAQLYIESQLRQKTPTDTKLHIGYKACMDSLPYQLEPAQMALKKPRQRILIADAVGLGKTLEAGILMSELIARGKGKRILVVTVKSMMAQFQKEMWNRFTIPLVRLDSTKIQQIRANLPSNYNPFFYYDKTIISIDTLKRDIEYRTHLENATWDIIVIDEAQNVARRGDRQAQRSRLAELLSNRSDTMIMLSATPHDGHPESFASLMNMLDPTAIADPQNYTADDIKGLFIRRFKKDIKNQVSGSFLERNIQYEKCDASIKEETVYDYFAKMKLIMDSGKKIGTGQLFKTSLQKALFSSPAACIKSVDERLKKLHRKYDDTMLDIMVLENLKKLLLQIGIKDFSRYQKLLSLLNDPGYDWHKGETDDRIVIFTERIETMKFLAEHLRNDLHMNNNQVQELSGSMSDIDIQKIVEDFGRTESPIRILVASDVASEGLNLHYLSHRMIHFDIPWSLMVFQQRNGRIDRYGQQKRPDIRYMVETCQNPTLKGDLHNLLILAKKEDQAQKNIGDPSLLLGQFDIEKEELIVAGAMERHDDEKTFSDFLDDSDIDDVDPIEEMLAEASPEESSDNEEIQIEIAEDKTLLSDNDYLYYALSYLGEKTKQPIERLNSISGLDIGITDEMRRRLKALMPEEALPKGDHLIISSNIKYCMKAMQESLKQNLESTAWPSIQYLWKLHPIFSWVNDKTNLLFKRGEVPVIGLKEGIDKGDILFITNGTYPNKRSTSLIDDWFGLFYQEGVFARTVSMPDIIRLTGLNHIDLVNASQPTAEELNHAYNLLTNAVREAMKYMSKDLEAYRNMINPQIDEELDKLGELEKKHKHYQISLFESDRKKSEAERKVDELFNRFELWVKDTMTIEDHPYIRFVAVLMGV